MKPVDYVRPICELTAPFEGPLRWKLAAPVNTALERLLLLKKLDQFYADVVRGDGEAPFIERVLESSARARKVARGPRVPEIVSATLSAVERNSYVRRSPTAVQDVVRPGEHQQRLPTDRSL